MENNNLQRPGFLFENLTASMPPNAPPNLTKTETFRSDIIQVIRGFCMGAADTVPGVSGGTVALILGHYKRLVTAISNFDSTLFQFLRTGRIRAAAAHVDLRFLVALGAGIGLGVVSLAGAMHWLLDHKTPETLAVFFGLVLASLWVVKDYVDRWDGKNLLGLAVSAAIAFGITWLPSAETSLSLSYLFISASIAICAMILPGISGAFVLLLLGVYHPVTGMIKDAVRGHVDIAILTQLAVFASGCVFGLLAFSRLLRWLLEHHRSTTMAALMGLMVGSVGRLWPLQRPTAETLGLELKYREMQFVSPGEWPGGIGMLVILAFAAGALVIAAERVASRIPHES